jgi:hypothetical protein
MANGVRVFDVDARQVMHLTRPRVTDDGSEARGPENRTSAAATDEEVRLPPYDRLERRLLFIRALRVHPVEPGRAILVGRFGKHQRLWFAEARIGAPDSETGAAAVKVFHTCTEIQADRVGPDDNPHQIFGVYWLTELQGMQWSRRLLLVGRTPTNVRWDVGRRPLMIDVDSLQVGVFPARFPPHTLSYFPRYSHDGRFLYVAGHRLNIYTHNPHDPADWQLTTHLDGGERKSKLRQILLDHEGHIYLPGTQWWRIQRSTWKLEALTPDPLPARMQFDRYAVSAHRGVIAWNRGGPLYRVTVAERE